MTEHRARIEIARPAAEVFAFLANPMNLPRWQPALREAFRDGPKQVRVVGGGIGADGIARNVRFAAEHDARRLSWATPTGVGCAGDAAVTEYPGGAAVELTLRLGARADRPYAAAHWTGDPGVDLDAALRASLQAVRLHCEGASRGVEPVSGGTQSDPSRAPLRDSRAFGNTATQNPTTN